MTLESTELKTAESSVFWAKLTSLGQLGLISDPHIFFKIPGIGLMITKEHKI